MNFQKILISGGAGFVGSNLSVLFKQSDESVSVVAVDSLKRRGSELSLPRLKRAGVEFLHADVRCSEDLDGLPDFDLLIDCSAEPSVQAGLTGSPKYVLDTNLNGTINLLEAARQRNASLIFLSTSRVYPIEQLNELAFEEEASRFCWKESDIPGFSAEGISERFPLDGARSMYGVSKLASELIIGEYVGNYGMRAIINRCGILAGPWQMGKVDQGVITLWCASHLFKKTLRYIGFGGEGKQVRDVLHIQDLFDLLLKQISKPDHWNGGIYNIGGGNQCSTSLAELTEICREVTGMTIDITPSPETSTVDLRIYITDSRLAHQTFDWSPQHSVLETVSDIKSWILENRSELEPLLS